MEKATELQQLINATETLINSNKQLTKVNTEAFELIRTQLKKEADLLEECGKLYKLLHSKNNKTWEENDSIEILYRLITRTENPE